MNGWHKCHLCDCEFYDPAIDGYWGWCPGCRELNEKISARGKAKGRVGQMHPSSRWETSREPTLRLAKVGKAPASSR